MSAAAFERQVKPVYDSLDNGSPKTAITHCNKLLKKYPKNNLIKALKALALVRLQRVEESIILCDEVLAAKSTEDATMTAMQHVLRGLGRHNDMVAMFDNAYKQQPTNEELGAQTFFANVRTGNWKVAQQVAAKMHKHFREDRYLYWGVISAVLQANDPTTPPAMRTLLFKLAHRQLTSCQSPSHLSPDRFHLHITILKELELYDEALEVLGTDTGKQICATSLLCNEVRREIWRSKGLLKEEAADAETRIVDKNDRNWLEFLSVLDGTFAALRDGSEASESAKTECSEAITKTHQLFSRLAEQDGLKDRSGLLGLLELEKRARSHGLSTDESTMVDLMQRYFNNFGDKGCCFEDLKPYLGLENAELSKWTSFLESVQTSISTEPDLKRTVNVHLLLRRNLSTSEITSELESSRASQYLQEYLEALKLGASLPSTELQPADDLAILTAQVFVNIWRLTDDDASLYNAACLLEFSLTRSAQSFKMRLLLVRIYTLLGASSLALEHYRAIGVKQVQNDTLSHFVLSRASTFSLAATGDLTYSSECIESSQIYMVNSQDTSEFIIGAFTREKYSQIPDFISFEDQLDNSLARDAVKIEHVRMRIAHEPIASDLIDLELVELKFILNRFHHDNRDFDILPNYQPHSVPSFNEQTLLFEKSTGLGWLSAFLKAYISVLQQASDLDDSVEDKLLVGDRPKQSNDPEIQLPWKERLSKRTEEELKELTADEVSFMNYVTTLTGWLEPYHNHTRPPPAAVLAEATKHNNPKAIKGAEHSPQNGNGTNGHAKKAEEAPPITGAPEGLSKFFDDMNVRFKSMVQSGRLPTEVLHVVTLTQEAFLLFNIEILRFKTPSVVKVHKLGALVASFKGIRTKAIDILREMSAELIKIAEQEGTADRRKAIVDACKPIIGASQIDHDFALNVAKRVSDSRKKVQDGVGKGVANLCNTYSTA